MLLCILLNPNLFRNVFQWFQSKVEILDKKCSGNQEKLQEEIENCKVWVFFF